MKRIPILLALLAALFFRPGNDLPSKEKLSLAILDLKAAEGVTPDQARVLTELLKTDMVNTGLFTVIERSRIEAILKEQSLQQTGCVETSCAVQIGQLLAARKIMVGNVSRLGRKFIITARIIDVEKGSVDFAEKGSSSSIERAEFGIDLLTRRIVARFTGGKMPEASPEDQGRAATGGITGQRGLLLVQANHKCRLTLDGEQNGVLLPRNSQKFELLPGDHLLECRNVVGAGIRQKFQIRNDRQTLLSLDLRLPNEYTNSIGMKFKLIPDGSFRMGDQNNAGASDEKPVHRVKITKAFYLGRFEVTQGEWFRVMGTRPWRGQKFLGKTWHKDGDDYPAVWVNLSDVREFLGRLNRMEKEFHYRLPTEAEWEYACRTGGNTKWSFGNDKSRLGLYSWYRENTWKVGERYPHRVGQKKPNAWGLYDMHGNAWEWVVDFYSAEYYGQSPQRDPAGPVRGKFRILRGGSFNYPASGARCALRLRYQGELRDGNNSFRIVLDPDG